MTKLEWADGIRGLAAVTVILQHFLNAFFPRMNGPFLPEGAEGWNFMTYPFIRSIYAGNFSVHVFFVLSGIVVPFRYLIKGSKDLGIIQSSVIRRPARLLVPVIPLSIISYIMYLAHAYDTAADIKFLSILAMKPKFRSFGQFLLDTFIGIWMTDGNTYIPQAWTLSYEMMGSILLYVVLLGIHGLQTRFRVGIVAMLCFFFAVAPTFYGVNIIYYHDFLVGLLIAMFIVWRDEVCKGNRNASSNESKSSSLIKKHLVRWTGNLFFLLGLFFGSYPLTISGTGGINASYWRGMKSISDPTELHEKFWYTLGGTFLIFGIVLSDWLQWFFSLRLFAFIGHISYPMYLIHLQLMASAGVAIYKKLYYSAQLSHGASALTMLAIYTIIIIPLSWVGVPLLDKPSITVGRWMEKRIRKKEQPTTILVR